MGVISVQFESLQNGEQGIRNTYAKLTSTLEQLNADLQPMIDSWSGTAQEAYLAGKRQWDEAATSLSFVLRDIGVAVGHAHQTYAQAEACAGHYWVLTDRSY